MLHRTMCVWHKADIPTVFGPLSEVKQTSIGHSEMPTSDPKGTSLLFTLLPTGQLGLTIPNYQWRLTFLAFEQCTEEICRR